MEGGLNIPSHRRCSVPSQYDPIKELPGSSLERKRKKLVKVGGVEIEIDSIFTQANYSNDLSTMTERASKIDIPARGDSKRIDLPQISDSAALMSDLNDRGIRYETQRVDPASLIPTQSEFNEDRVLSIMKNPTSTPIVISRDDFIVDGHHRWLASYNAGSPRIEAIVINLNIDGCMKFLEGKPYVQNKSIKEAFSTNIILKIMSNFKSIKKALETASKIYKSDLRDKDLQIAKIARMHGIPPKEFMDLVVSRMTEEELSTFCSAMISEEKVPNVKIRLPGENKSGVFVESEDAVLITFTEKNK